jgi:hypothetical protein
MSKKYIIKWKSKVNGRAGRGTKLFEREEGADLVQELNRDYPDIEHELINFEGSNLNRSASDRAEAAEEGPEENENAAVQNPHVISFDA